MVPFKMKLLPELFIVLLCFSSMSLCVPTSWQVNQLKVHDDVIQREERDVSDGSGHGSGAGPCSDDEDSPCHRGETQVAETSKEYPKPHIVSLQVETSITARYVSTTVVTVMKNRAPVSQDSNFRFRLTKDAFISDFFMVVEGETYQAEVEEKQAAQKAYNEARQRGQTAGQIKQSDNDFTKFETNINLSPKTTATFHLTFQELLRRKNGVFQHRINLFPKEIVQHLRADVYITEPQGISFANITWEQDDTLTTDFLYDALSVEYRSDERVHAQFNPSEVDQEGLSETGLEGDLVITYDVVHDSGAGHIEVVNGYFVHHISPVGIPVTRKDVVFVIDVSGSMSGSKIEQTKLAMSTIIDEIRDFDRFNIISFSTETRIWKENLVEASGQNKEEALTFVNSLNAIGGTDIYQGVMEAVRKLQELEDTSSREAFPMIVLLTDGEPTSGVTNTEEIVKLTTDAIHGKIALFSLAFGEDADYDLLEKLSGNNNGLARRIYHDSNPSLQLEGFYKEVATPLLFNVQVNYDETAIEMDSLTDTNFICYYEGTELVIAGKLREDFTGNEISAVVSGNSFDVNVEWGLTKEITTERGSTDNRVLKGHVIDDFAQRLWAYVTIKDLLLKSHVTIDQDEKTLLRDRALSLALKYKFVTPLTSLIVIKPENYQHVNDGPTEEEDTIQEDYDYYSVSMDQAMSMQQSDSYSLHYYTPMLLSGSVSLMLQAPVQQSDSYSVHYAPMLLPGSSSSMLEAPPSLARPTQVSSGIAGPRTPSGGCVFCTAYSAQVDGDPHFRISLAEQNASLCFSVHGRDRLIANLISDPKYGMTLNAQFKSFEDVSTPESVKIKSYFTTVGIVLGTNYLLVTPEEIAFQDMPIDWTTSVKMTFHGYEIQVFPQFKLVAIRSTEGITVNIRRHRDERAWMRNKVDHLGIYVEDSSGFSDSVDGLLGQFYRNKLVIYESEAIHNETDEKTATLKFTDKKIPLVWRPQQKKDCWHVRNKNETLSDPSNFEVDALFQKFENN
ncbi:Inter-alpha-trypsin inhibitor heavy chain H3 [Holothuria leucospilota]|uniref:Inter-alpha-trypsin inhibitor heavy chain H3 n=1 Tax=Holothuria leucospilota TaxID=206669 RepID=A0A9Q1CJU0_HOLLE|nr:Inter-alpha-trypsin inhibitor heavy chain H3 [Holothuria leucospilota]